MNYNNSRINVEKKLRFSVILDKVKDPGNMGTIIRTAAAIGCHSVLVTSESANPWSSKVLRSAMGAHFHVRIVDRVSRAELAKFIKSKQVVYADSKFNYKSLSYTRLETRLNGNQHVCLIVGNETKGISEDLYELADRDRALVVRVPIENEIESLNCSIAFAVIAFEIRKFLHK